ncbi:hypothetical protein B7R54_14270 [Subtercola boreus]|uniref:Uncharacterized protein n=1 Tax=Subtercola boreus TaxID=120213 RepID=A0A3E0VJU9_9MICO|nr:hypothetical protein [Subtercola boreus]RFA10242.1 hypothetical protein B7R54_14270 [Subtercola boreus]TQL52580.1 hypothetical protein FB464_0063 [Subtercola boreus]
MERIHYTGGSILTGSDIARALLDYAGALAATDGSEIVDIPSLHSDGTIGRATFLIGPASQLVSETEPSDHDELVDADLVAGFRASTARLTAANVAGPAEPIAYTEELDDL